jgi:hypothetical protein
MIIKRALYFMMAIVVVDALAQQSTPYLLLQFPKMAKAAAMPDTVGWTGIARPLFAAPDSGVIYFDRSPGGSVISNYRYKIDKFCIDTVISGRDTSRTVQNNIYLPGKVPQRMIVFKPSEQTNMGYGLFYYVVGLKTNIMGKDTTFVSNELEFIVESPVPTKPKAPLDTITELTPVFQWEPNPSVPYYHVILSDEALTIDTVHGLSISGISVSWQAITPFTQIVYGSADPSGTLTSSPPPLSPGKTYYWAVLNNYKNNILYTSSRVGLPVSFTVKGNPMIKAKNITPKNVVLTSSRDSIVTFQWTNLDPRANTYKLYLYIASGLSQVDAKMVVWSSEITSGTFAGSNGRIDTTDTGFITINARSVLSKNHYTWKVFAIDDKGASTAGDTCSFEYTDPATGRLTLSTREKIVSSAAGGILDTTLSIVAAVQMQVEVVKGSLEAPLLFYTDLGGNLDRERPAGTYRITAQKSGFEPLVKTITLDSGATVNDIFYLKRPDATVFGKVVDKTNTGINVARVYAVSDRGDTVTAETDVLGNFIVNCYEGSWQILAQKTGFSASLPKQAQVTYGQSYPFGNITLNQNLFTLSATVVNENKEPILGADVKVYREAAVIDEIPSTPQSGTVSFALNAGTYTINAAKIGFEQYSKIIDLSGSVQLSIVMASGAGMIKGAVIGATWVGNVQVYAPITSASVVFTDTTEVPEKTFSTLTDATYGDYGISVSGGRRFTAKMSANGFIPKTTLLPEATKAGNTLMFYDTLQSLGMVTGGVIMSGSGAVIGNATITLLTPFASRVAASATSQGNGYFEIRNLPDGVYYVKAGAPGVSLDSVRASDTLYVSSGKTTIQGSDGPAALKVYMSAGSKTVTWVVSGGRDTSAIISIKSPLQKIIRSGQSLTDAGYGDYIVSVNGKADSIIDCAYHSFTVLASESLHIDSVELPVFNATLDSLSIINDSISLRLSSEVTLDSAVVFYRDIATPEFSSFSRSASQTSYLFSLRPPKDGSIMNYYFKAYRGKDIYGSSGETFFSYVRPDTTRLSKVEFIPSAGDTVFLGAQSELRIAFRGYFGSTFIPASLRDTTAILWRLSNAPRGTHFRDSTGVEVAFVTGDESTTQPVALTAIIDTTKQKVTPQVLTSGNKTMYFILTGKKVTAIHVRRIDAGGTNPITTSALAMAQFVAEGLDASETVSMISPTWSVSPSRCGAITPMGTFKPSSRFAGMARIYAQANGLTGEYNVSGKSEKQYGLEVKHYIVAKDQTDTASNMQGCALFLPDSVVPEDKPGLLQISMPAVDNRLELTTGALTVVGPAYDINEDNGVIFRFSGADSIRLVLDIPEASMKQNADKVRLLSIGRWDADSLKWTALSNSMVDVENHVVSANIRHFSRYALLTRSTELTSTLSILPNPFSPDRRASEFPSLALRLGNNTPQGTCISFTPESPDAAIQQIRVAIYSIAGEQVAKVVLEGASKLVEYRLWWDGRATGRDRADWPKLEIAGKDPNARKMSGKAMCRNGRYFVVLTIRDFSGKEKNYMKQVVLIK